MGVCEVPLSIRLDALLWNMLMERCTQDGVQVDTTISEAIRLWLIVQKRPWVGRGEIKGGPIGEEEAEELADMCLPSARYRAIFGEGPLEEARILFAPYATVPEDLDSEPG